MDFSCHTVCLPKFRTGGHLPIRQEHYFSFAGKISRYISGVLLLLGILINPLAQAAGDAARGRFNWEYTCQHCHGVPQPNSSAAFSDYDITANRLSVYASDPAAITKAATDGYTIPEGNINDKAEPGRSTSVPMGTWAGLAANRLGVGTTPTQYAIDFAAYFATFFEVPEAPKIGAVAAGNGTASVSFAAPKSDLTITAYTVTANPGGFTATGTTSPIVVSGLSNGTAYTFTISATSNAGTGKPSSASNAVSPVAQQAVAVRSAPTAAAVVASTIPAAPVPAVRPPVSAPVIAAATKPVASIIPAAPANVAVSKVTPAKTAPAAILPASSSIPPPTIIAAKPGSAEARVFFSVPQSAAIIESFTVVAYTGGVATGIKASGTGSPIKVTGLTNGTDYTFYVIVNGKSGAKTASAVSNVVTPLSIFGD
jgi:hypothetical protein